MHVSPVFSSGGFPAGKTDIDRRIQALTKRKQEIVGKIRDVLNGKDDPKIKKKKIEAMRMEIRLIDLEIARLQQKKADRAKGKAYAASRESDRLPPSLSGLIHPGPGNNEAKRQLNVMV